MSVQSYREQIAAVFCPTCAQETLPLKNGKCGWCDALLVPELAPVVPVQVCRFGHRIEGDNIYFPGKDRPAACRQCHRDRNRARMRARRAAL